MAQARLIAGGGAAQIGAADPWTPWTIPRSVDAAWWAADDLANGSVSTWLDRMRALSLAPFAGTGSAPVKAATSFNSAYPGVTGAGSGTSDCLQTTTLTNLPTAAVPGEIWSSYSQTGISAISYICFYGGTGANAGRTTRANASGTFTVSDGTTANNSTLTPSGPAVGMGNWSGTSMNAYLNGTDGVSNPTTITTLNTSTTRLRLFANNSATPGSIFTGVIRHVLILTGISSGITLPGRSTTLKQDLEGFFAWDSGFQASLPTTHPWRFQAP